MGAKEDKPGTASGSGLLQPFWKMPDASYFVCGSNKWIWCKIFKMWACWSMLQIKKKKICSQKNERNLPIKELRNSHSDESKILTECQFPLKKIDHLLEGEISMLSGTPPTEWTWACGLKSYFIFFRLPLNGVTRSASYEHRDYCK